ncbi:restriction endonuclease subunit S [Rothia terrae]|uniref:restriction endonuclease subunit S n=1 Tax=Rothia terrae TaxID=396015 RepID=UPI003807CCE8
MSKIQDLIDELCPDGIVYKPIEKVAKIKNGRDYKHLNSGRYPVYGSGGVMTHVDYFIYDKVSVLIPRKGSLGNVYYQKDPFWVVDTIFYTQIDESQIIPKYFYHVLIKAKLAEYNQAGGVPSLTQKVLNKIKIPVPPLEVQKEIVRILDRFTLLEAELEARRKQYAHYRDSLLFSDKIKYNYLNLSEVGVISTGKTPSKLESSAWSEGINFVTPSDIRNGQKYISSSERTVDKEWVFNKNWKVVKDNSILVTCIGADMGKAVIPTQESVFNQQINSIEVSDNVDIEYLYYWLVSRREYMLRLGRKNGSTMPILNKTNFSKIVVNLPELWLQRKISKQISVFDALVNDISSGLPAEIAARRKQYEYYRDQLLTFKELESASA